MLVTTNIRDQIVSRFPGRSFGAEKFGAHVVVDPDYTRAVGGETPDRFRAN
jgi:hypothetical protein